MSLIYSFLAPADVQKVRKLNRELSLIVRQSLEFVETKGTARTIDVIKLMHVFPNVSHIVYRHFLTELDIKNCYRMYTNSLVKFELHGRHFSWQKAFAGIKLPNLKFFALTDSTQIFIRDDIMAFGKACPNVTHLNLSGVSNLENE